MRKSRQILPPPKKKASKKTGLGWKNMLKLSIDDFHHFFFFSLTFLSPCLFLLRNGFSRNRNDLGSAFSPPFGFCCLFLVEFIFLAKATTSAHSRFWRSLSTGHRPFHSGKRQYYIEDLGYHLKKKKKDKKTRRKPT